MNYRMFIIPNLISMLLLIGGFFSSVVCGIILLVQIIRNKEKRILRPFIISAVAFAVALVALVIFAITGTYVLIS